MAKGVQNFRGKCRIHWQHDGVRKYKLLSVPFTPQGIKQAEKIRLAAIAEHKTQEAAAELNKGEAPTLLTLARLYLDRTDLAPSSDRKMRGILNRYWLPYLRNKKVTAITKLKIAEIEAAHMKHLSKRYKKDVIAILHVVLEQAVPEFLSHNPASRKWGKRKTQKANPFTIEERDQILGAIYESEQAGNTYLFYMIRFYAGLRPGEVIALNWDDYDGETLRVTKTITDGVEKQTPKNEENRLVNLHPKLVNLLNNHPTRFKKGRILQFDNKQAYKRYDSFSAKFSKIREELGIAYRDPYNVRHTCATMMLEAGMQPAYCAKQLGHNVDEFLNTYSQWLNREASMAEHEKWSQVN